MLAKLKINPIDLKFQCKQEARKLLMRVRHIYIKITQTNYNISLVLPEIVSCFLVIFRTILRIKKIDVPKFDRETIFIVSELAKLRSEPFIYFLQCKNDNCKPNKQKIIELTSQLLDELSMLLNFIDRL